MSDVSIGTGKCGATPVTTGNARLEWTEHQGLMVDLVLPEMRMAFAMPLMQMHQDRKRVFIDVLGWDLPCTGSWLEVDDFDNERAVYLLARSPETGAHEGSVRLLPTSGRHMLAELFSVLCAGPVPAGEDIWEISRLVTRPPSVPGTSVVRVHRLLALALVEFALLNSIRRYTLVTEADRVPALLSVGWAVEPLGLPAQCLGQELQALQISVCEATLEAMRSKLKIDGDVLNIMTRERRAA